MECFGFNNGKDLEEGRGNTNDQYPHGDKGQDDHSQDHYINHFLQRYVQRFRNAAGLVNEHDDRIVEIQQKALDDIVNVNSLFTIAVFVGLAFASPGQRSLENRPECDADYGVGKRLIMYEVVSFAFFLLSSLTAKTLKVQLHIHNFNYHLSFIKYRLVRGLMLLVSFLASLLGIIFLTLSMVNVIQIRLGKLSCGSLNAIQAVAALCGIVFVALAIYLPSTANVIWVLITTLPSLPKKDQNN